MLFGTSIRNVQDRDINDITDIYNEYISNSVITFETQTITAENMRERTAKILSDGFPWLTAVDESNKVIGYAYASKWRERFAYRFSVEITVYLSPHASGRGVGTQLYHALFSELRLRSLHCVIAGITLPNPASVALHEKLGMKKVAHFKEVGFKFDQWLDVGYWQGSL